MAIARLDSDPSLLEAVEGASGWPFDAIVIAVIVVLNAVLGYVQQARAEHAVEALQRLSATTRKLMTSLEADTERAGKIAVVTKGAPDVLLNRCSHVQVDEALEPLDRSWRTHIIDEVERLSGEAFRTLAVAYRPLEVTVAPEIDESLEQDLVFAGMVGIIDPPRQEAADAIAEAHRAGVRHHDHR